MSNAKTIRLRGGKGHRDERVAAGAIKPGHLVAVDSDDKVAVHATYGGHAELMFALEDSLQGNIISTAYAAADVVFTYQALPGDIINARCPALAAAIVKGDKLISDGTGCLVKAVVVGNQQLYSNTAASSSINTVAVETAFSLSYTFTANTLKAGDVVRIRGQGLVSAVNASDTLIIKVKVGSTAIYTSATVVVAANDIFVFDAEAIIRTIGTAGTFVGYGTGYIGTPGVAAGAADIPGAGSVGSTAINTTTTVAITVTATWSASSANNACRLDNLSIELLRTGNQRILAVANEAVDNSAGVAEAMIAVRALS
jgi:hypothetical protein